MNTQDKNRGSELDGDKAPVADHKPVSRRKMLRGAAAAVPAILTLHSGSASALARSSNMLSLVDGVKGDGPALCLDVTSLESAGVARYDLGSPPHADITSIPTDLAFYSDTALKEKVTPYQMCQEGGTYYYKSDPMQLARLGTTKGSDVSTSGFAVRKSTDLEAANVETAETINWKEAKVTGHGGLVSASALTSFLGMTGINVKNINI